jgi:probable rRNA maturation factor
MTYHIVVQRVTSGPFIPDTKKLKRWIKATLQTKLSSAEITLRIVDINEIHTLNNTYRHKNKPTNVLSFPFDQLHDIDMKIPMLGDIVICATIVNEEAGLQNKSEMAHWAHMVIHGTLHLLGYDHVIDQDAENMEQEEVNILNSLGFADPYQIIEKGKTS